MIENEFYNKVNTVISEKITPFYNTFLLLSGCFFTYYVLMGEQQCYATDRNAYGIEYDNTQDVTYQFFVISYVGIGMMLLSSFVYFLQGRPGMYDLLRPYLIIVNLSYLAWFVAL